jgi:hypothetical protein
MKFVITIIILIFILLPAVQAQPHGSISGFIYDNESGESLVGANVFLQDTYMGSASNSSGFYSIPRIPVGSYTLVCQFIGYETFSKKITVKPNSSMELNIRLKPRAIATEEISVIADSVRTSLRLYRKPISKIQLTPRDIKRAPQFVESDLLRSLQTMPGIAAISDFSSELYVRGGTPDQNLYLIDGTDVYNPEHFFGLFSTFNTDAIKSVEFSKGGFGAEYGGRLSSVMDVTNLDGNRKEFKAKTSVSLLSAKTTLQVPMGELGSVSGSIRRTYFDQTIAKMEAFKDENIPNYYFYDGHLKAFFDLNRNNKLTISFYKSKDNLDFTFNPDNDNSESFQYKWGNMTSSLRWTRIFSSSLFANFWLTCSSYDSKFDFGDDFQEENSIDDWTAKAYLEYYYSKSLSAKMGFEYKDLAGSYTAKFPGGEVDVGQTPLHAAAYTTLEWQPSPLLELQSGIRYNTSRNQVVRNDLSPRFSLKYRLSETTNLKAAAGRYHQYLFKIPRAFIADIWTASNQYYDDAKASHYILGFQKEIADNIELEIESYYKHYSNIYYYDAFFWVDLEPNAYNEDNEPLYTSTKNLFDTGQSRAYGLEVLLRRDVGALTGWISYTIGHSDYKIYGLNQNNWFTPRHDRTHMLNLVTDMDIRNMVRILWGKPQRNDRTRWRLGIGLNYASGQPITIPSYVYTTRQVVDQDFYYWYNLGPIERNNFRLPPYIRFDLNLTVTRKFKHFTLEPYIQVFNATSRDNVWFIQYDESFENNQIKQEIDTVPMIPIPIPSIGFNIIF